MILATVISVGPNHLENKNRPDHFLHLFGCQAASKFSLKPAVCDMIPPPACCHVSVQRVFERETQHIGLCIAIILISKHWRARKQAGNR